MSQIVILLIVGALFYLLTKGYKDNPYTIKVDKKERFTKDIADHEVGLLVAMMAKVAKADGRVSELEAELLSNTFTQLSSIFENSSEIRERLKSIYKAQITTFENTLEIAKKYYDLTKNDYRKRLKTLEYLLNIAFIDNEFTNEEFMICEDIASTLKIKKSDFEAMVAKFREFYANEYNKQVDTLENAYKVLGASEEDDMATIKSKYKKLVRENHPDLLMGKGASESIIEEATKKLQEINEAYEIIKKNRS